MIPGGPMCPARIKDNKMEEKDGGGYTKDTIENIEQVMEAHYDECWMKALAIQDRLKKTVCVDMQYMDEVSGWIVSIDQRIVSIVHLMKASYSGVVMNVVERIIESFVHPDVFNDWVFKFHANDETPGGQSVVR
jgi:hypothetical protein